MCSFSLPARAKFDAPGIARRSGGALLAGLISLTLAGCAAPVGVERGDARSVGRTLTRSVIADGQLSGFSQIVINRRGLADRADADPDAVLGALHAAVTGGNGGQDEVFALAEFAFLTAEKRRDPGHYLAAAVYAYAFLFPAPPYTSDAPNPFDPRLRIAADLYNRALTEGFSSPDSTEVRLRGGRYRLPFGSLDVAFDETSLRWAGRRLVRFVPAAEFKVYGLRNRYRQPGIGAPLAAATEAVTLERDGGPFIAREVQVPVTALLRIDNARRQLAGERLRAVLELYPATATDKITIAGQSVPLEAEPTAALAYQLDSSRVWGLELRAFLFGDLGLDLPDRLIALEPYRRGRIPVVLVHGTASSPGRWAEMLNELKNDPRLRERYQFWFFTYNTGNPMPYSALQLREALERVARSLDPDGQDPALARMVVMGHSQGGLLTKLLVVNTDERLWNVVSNRPLASLDLSEDSRELLRRGLFLEPLPFVRRVVFMATPQRGSYVAGSRIGELVTRIIRLPGQILSVTADLLAADTEAFGGREVRIGSVHGMTPGSPFIQALAAIPVAEGVAAHSIIAVRGDGPPEEGDDGVVEYQSAHIDEAVSEKVIRSGHSTQMHPDTIEEVRRILLLHLDDVEPPPGMARLTTNASP